jgi:crossover junction endodeoxyribonuclease RusA
MQVTLPWPPASLSPNSRCHWRVKASVGKKYRADVYYLCKAAKLSVLEPQGNGRIHISLHFYPPDNRRRDLDNCVSSLKWGLDGLAEALKINDERFVIHPALFIKTGGEVVVKICENWGKTDDDIS